MLVAVAAIVAASIFNVLALRRAGKTLELAEQTFTRTEQRYQADRQEARNDRLRDALIDVSFAVASYNLVNAWYAKLLKDFATGSAKAGLVQEHDVEKLRPAAANAYRALKVALFLSEDARITGILNAIEAEILAATNLVTSHGDTPSEILGAASGFRPHRESAASKASELLDVAREVLGGVPSDAPLNTSAAGEVRP